MKWNRWWDGHDLRSCHVTIAWGLIALGLLNLVLAEDRADRVVVDSLLAVYEDVKNNTLAAAELVPEDGYSFRPGPSTRSYGQQLAHIADSNYLFCSAARGEPNPYPSVPGEAGALEKTRVARRDILEALERSFQYCDAAFARASDSNLAELVEFSAPNPIKVTRAFLLNFGAYHAGRHYGSLAVYLRLKGVVPPSTASQPQSQSGGTSGPERPNEPR